MDKARFDKGLEVRTAVLGKDYVEASMKNADDFNRPFQELVTDALANALRASCALGVFPG